MKIIVFGAVWCPACLVMKPVIKKLKIEYPDLEIINYDYDLNEEEVEKYQIGKLLPEFIFLTNNKEINRLKGEKDINDFINIIEGSDV